MSIWADLIGSFLLYVQLSFCFFLPNICLISGESNRNTLELTTNNNRSINTLNVTIPFTISKDDQVKDHIFPTGSANFSLMQQGLTLADPPRKPRMARTTTVTPGCESGTLQACEEMQPVAFGLGIPATPSAIQKACKVFNKAMECYYTWAKRCIRDDQTQKMQKLNMSVLGANEIFTFLCRDPKFQQNFLQHNKCYTKISKRWDACAVKFIDVLQSREINSKDESDVKICCLRYGYIQCVMQITHHKCDSEDPKAARFIQQMAETLLRFRIQGHSPEQCDHIKHELHEHCPTDDSATSILKFPFNLFLVSGAILITQLHNFVG